VIEAAVRCLGVADLVGRARALSGMLVLDDEDPTSSWVRVDVDARSFRTGHRALDEAVRDGDLFDCDGHGIIRFESTDVRITGEREAEVAGDLYLGELVGPLTMTCRLNRAPGHLAVFARAKLSRVAWGLSWDSIVERLGAVSDTVNITAAARFAA
jgi:polyisoprenoid-binding protein YceI